MKTAIYKNRALKKEYKLVNVKDLESAWNLVDYVANRNGWNAYDIHVKLECEKTIEIGDNLIDPYTGEVVEVKLENDDSITVRYESNLELFQIPLNEVHGWEIKR